MVQIKYTLNLIAFIILLIRTLKVCGRDLSEQERALRAEFIQKLLNKQNKLEGKIKLLGGASKYEGNVYIYHAGRWGAVCDDSWDDEAAAVVCRSFNMTGVATVGGQYGETVEKYWLDDVICQGDEPLLSKCVFNRWGASDCGKDEAAGVMCMPEAESPRNNKLVKKAWPGGKVRDVLNLATAQLRLVGGKNTKEGRVEIFHNNTWGSICPDGWTHYEASVVCRHLDLGYAEQALQTYVYGYSEVVIAGINCEGNETSLFDCRHRQHGDIRCPGDFVFRTSKGTNGNLLRSLYCPSVFYSSQKVHNAAKEDSAHVVVMTHFSVGGPTEKRPVSQQWEHWENYKANDDDDEDNAGRIPIGKNCNVINLTKAGHAAAVVCTNFLADLVLDTSAIERSAHLQDVLMFQLRCAMEENCLSKSAYEVKELIPDWQYETRRLLRFTAASLNAGTAEFRPYLPKHLWQWHLCHMHYHSMEVFATFDVLDSNGLRVAEGHKASFCLEDNTCNPGVQKKYSCKNYGDQGISVNCSDVYKYNIDCQWVDVTDVQPGDYTFKVAVNPHARIAEQTFHNNAASCHLRLSETYAMVFGCKHERP